jgi:hypothetical protein
LRFRFEYRSGEAIEEEEGQEGGVEDREAVVGLNQPVVMDHAAERGDVDEAVEGLPVSSAEPANPSFGGRNCQWNQQDKTSETYGNEGTLGDVFQHGSEIKGLVGTDVGQEMQTDIGEGKEPEHAPETDEVREIEKFAKGRDGKGDEEEAKGPVTGEMLHKFDGISAELTVVSASGEEAKRGEAEQKNHDFGPAAEENFAERIAHVSSFS